MSDHNMEPKIRELMELKRMKEELEAEITTLEDEVKARMGDEETLLARGIQGQLEALHRQPV